MPTTYWDECPSLEHTQSSSRPSLSSSQCALCWIVYTPSASTAEFRWEPSNHTRNAIEAIWKIPPANAPLNRIGGAKNARSMTLFCRPAPISAAGQTRQLRRRNWAEKTVIALWIPSKSISSKCNHVRAIETKRERCMLYARCSTLASSIRLTQNTVQNQQCKMGLCGGSVAVVVVSDSFFYNGTL